VSTGNRVRWLIATLFLQAAVACADDRTDGVFELCASGGAQAAMRGSVYATSQIEIGGYWIAMDLTQQDSPLRTAEALSFEFASKPDSSSWSGVKAPLPTDHNFTIGFGVGSCDASRWDADSIAPSYWHVDSGRVHIKTPLASPGVSGSFMVFTHLNKCVAGDTTTLSTAAENVVVSAGENVAVGRLTRPRRSALRAGVSVG
jgi:hypothetical protein